MRASDSPWLFYGVPPMLEAHGAAVAHAIFESLRLTEARKGRDVPPNRVGRPLEGHTPPIFKHVFCDLNEYTNENNRLLALALKALKKLLSELAPVELGQLRPWLTWERGPEVDLI